MNSHNDLASDLFFAFITVSMLLFALDFFALLVHETRADELRSRQHRNDFIYEVLDSASPRQENVSLDALVGISRS